MRTTLKISEIITEWLASLDIVELTRRSYNYKLMLWFRYLARQKVDTRAPKRRNVIEYKRELEHSNKSELTVDGYVTVVKLFYKYLEEQNYYENIAAGVRSSHLAYEHRKESLTAIEAAALLASIETDTPRGARDKMIVALMLIYGLRACEVGRIDVGEFTRDENGVCYLKLRRKGRREKRETIAVSGEIYTLAKELSQGQKQGTPIFKATSGGNKGDRITSTTVGRIAKHRLRAVGIDRPQITGHSLRHTCASLLIERGVAVEDVRDVLGHSSTTTTRLYIQAAQKAKILRNNPSLMLDSELL